jgi:hypothetical protein
VLNAVNLGEQLLATEWPSSAGRFLPITIKPNRPSQDLDPERPEGELSMNRLLASIIRHLLTAAGGATVALSDQQLERLSGSCCFGEG